jgi:hypothetical protein
MARRPAAIKDRACGLDPFGAPVFLQTTGEKQEAEYNLTPVAFP